MITDALGIINATGVTGKYFLGFEGLENGGAGRNRTDDTCLEGRGFTIKL